MGKGKDLSDFEKGQIVMARRLGQSISKTADLVGCSRCAVVSTYKKWSKEGQPVNRRQGHGRPRLIDARGERRLSRLVRSHRKDTVAQIAEKVNAGYDRKVSQHTVHRSLLRLGLRRCRPPVRVSMVSSDQQLGQERLSEPAANEWSGENGEEKDGAPGVEQENSAGYCYEPLNQEPDGGPHTQLGQNDEATHADQLQEVQERIEVCQFPRTVQRHAFESASREFRTLCPESPEIRSRSWACSYLQPPAPDSENEEDTEVAAEHQSHTSISVDPDHIQLVKKTIAVVNLPTLAIPKISDNQWKDMVQKTLLSWQSSAGLFLQHK